MAAWWVQIASPSILFFQHGSPGWSYMMSCLIYVHLFASPFVTSSAPISTDALTKLYRWYTFWKQANKCHLQTVYGIGTRSVARAITCPGCCTHWGKLKMYLFMALQANSEIPLVSCTFKFNFFLLQNLKYFLSLSLKFYCFFYLFFNLNAIRSNFYWKFSGKEYSD